MNMFVPLIFANLTIVATPKLTFDFKCPHRSHWTLRATRECEMKQFYHCLKDTNSMNFREKCLKPVDSPPGLRGVFSGQLNAKLCPDNQFSPCISWSNNGPECQYQKQLCNEEGQVVVDNGSNIRDIKCRCDYRHGYVYNVKPKNECLCSPSVEDCTCHLKQCQHNNLILSQDYICTLQDNISAITKCQAIVNNSDDNSSENKKEEITQSSVTGLHRKIFLVPSVIFIAFVCFFILFFCCQVLYILYISNVSRGENDKRLLKTVKHLSKFSELKNQMRKTSVLIFKGRQGTGKTTLAKCLRGLYSWKSCKIIDLRISLTSSSFNSTDSDDNITAFRNEIESCVTKNKGTKLIIVVETFPNNFVTFPERILKGPADVVDFDIPKFYNDTDREKILKLQMKINNIYHIDELNQSQSIDVSETISIETFNTLLSEDTLLGFPSMCASFCSHIDHIKLGIKYVRQPPSTLIEKLDELRQQGESNDCSAIQYGLLVSVLLRYRDEMSLREMIKNFLTKNMREIYSKKERVQFDIAYVEAIASSLMPYYLNSSNSGLKFSDHLIYQAVLISYGKKHPFKVLDECDICDIILFLRPAKYHPLHDEMVLRVEYRHLDFVTRVTSSVMFGDSIADNIIKHIIDFTENYDETDLLLSIIKNIKSNKLNTPCTHNSRMRFFRQCGIYPSKFFEDVNPEIYAYCLAWEYVFVKMENNENRLNKFKDTVSACDSDVIGKVLHTSIDEFGNTLFHYFIIWNGKAEQTIISILLSKSTKGELSDKDIANVWASSKLDNTNGLTPLHFAVFFGRYTFCLNCTSMKNITRNQVRWFKSAWNAITKPKEKDNIKRLLQSGINNNSNDVKDYIDKKIMFETDLIPSKSDIKFGDKCEFDHIKSILQ